MNKKVTNVIAQSGIKFGTSGARGLVSDFSDEACFAFTYAFINAMKTEFKFSRIALAMDNRPSSPKIAAAIAGAAKSIGIETDFYGVLPTPALALQGMNDCIPSVMVTGSHIPFDRNGIKFYRPDGEISKSDESAILESNTTMASALPLLPKLKTTATGSYFNRYLDYFGRRAISGLKIGIYEHSSAGRDLYKNILTQMGAEVVSLGRSDEFVPIDTEAVSDEDRLRAMKWSKQYGFDAIFSTDGDGDRPLIADENGAWLRGDIVGLLSSKFLGIEALAVPVSCNSSIEGCGAFKTVHKTKIGSPYVIEEFKSLKGKYSSYAGFEANGGFLLGSSLQKNGNILKALPTRDALLPLIVLLVKIVKEKQKLSVLISELPNRFTASDRIQNIPLVKSNVFIKEGALNPKILLNQIGLGGTEVTEVDTMDGLRLNLANGDIVHLRPSGNAPELRCYVETDNQEHSIEMVKSVLGNISVIAETL